MECAPKQSYNECGNNDDEQYELGRRVGAHSNKRWGKRGGADGRMRGDKEGGRKHHLAVQLNPCHNVRFLHEGGVFAGQRRGRSVIWERERVRLASAAAVEATLRWEDR